MVSIVVVLTMVSSIVNESEGTVPPFPCLYWSSLVCL